MTRWSSSTLFLARPKVPSWERELVRNRASRAKGSRAYPLLGELAGTLILAIAQQFDDTALVGCEAGENVS